MYRILSIFIFSGFCCLSNVQAQKAISYSLTANYGNLFIMQASLEGGPHNDLARRVGIDASLYYAISEQYSFKTGISWISAEIEHKPHIIDGTDRPTSYHDFNMLNIPIAIQRTFKSGFFLESGLLMSIDMNKDEMIAAQNGIGATVGLGYNFRLSPAIGITINTYIGAPTILQLSKENYPERLLDSGIRLGLRLF